MSKIVCDVCGASYPETESQCPICGTAKSESAFAGGDTMRDGDYAYVKGGRFSKANVKKRNSGNQELPRTIPAEKPARQPKQEKPPKATKPKKEKKQKAPRPSVERRRQMREEEESRTNVGLIIIVILLVLAIVGVCVFIVREALDRMNPGNPTTSTSSQSGNVNPTGNNQPTVPISIPCTSLRLPITEHTFAKVNDTLLLQPIPMPENTTETIKYISGDPRIATVDQNGKITAVADGETTIYVVCGSCKADLKVICNVGVAPPTEPTEPTEPTQPTEPPVILELNRTDFSLFGYKASHNLYSGPIDRSEITWTSSNEEVATVTNGKVVAVGNGVATITAEYKGQVATCIVRCYEVVKADFTLSSTDITLYVNGNNTYPLQAYDADGLRIDPSELVFSTSSEGFFSVDENGKITALQSNYGYYNQYVYVEYNGQTLKCIIRVRNG